MIAPGTLELFEGAVVEGAEVGGGIDPIGLQRDRRRQLDGILGIAARLDIHLHDTDEMGAVTLETIGRAQPRQRAARQGRDQPCVLPRQRDAAAVRSSRGPAGRSARRDHDARPGRRYAGAARTDASRARRARALRDRGRPRRPGPLDCGDMPERAYRVAHVNGLRDDPGIERTLEMAARAGAAVMGIEAYGLTPGCVADLVPIEAETAAEAVAAHPVRRLVVERGRVVARDGRSLLAPVA